MEVDGKEEWMEEGGPAACYLNKDTDRFQFDGVKSRGQISLAGLAQDLDLETRIEDCL